MDCSKTYLNLRTAGSNRNTETRNFRLDFRFSMFRGQSAENIFSVNTPEAVGEGSAL